MYALLLAAGIALQQPLTFDAALEHARQSAPAVVAARMRIDEARGRITLPPNPNIDIDAGTRSGAAEYGVAIEQPIDSRSRRRARIDATNAFVTQEEQRAREVERDVLREVAIAFLRAVEAREREEAATSGKHLAEEAHRIAERRYAAGDVAQLDVNLARTAVARADAESRIAAATLTGQVTQLQVLLGITEPLTIAGSLRDAPTLATNDLLARASDRPDIRVLDAEIAEAEAEGRVARTLRWPEWGLRASYSHEEGNNVFLGGVGFSLPIFNRGQEATAITNARLARLRVEREALTRTIEAQISGAAASYDALRNAASEYQRAVLPLIEENERLALESYEVGQIGLGDLLLVRREALDARRAFIDQLIETRLAEVELRANAGAWQ